MQPTPLDVVARHLPSEGSVLTPGGAPPALALAADRVHDADPASVATGSQAAALLIDQQLSDAGVHAEELIDTVAGALEPHGVLAATAHNRVFAAATGMVLHDTRGYAAAELSELLHHRGFTIDVLCAPGAAAGLRGREDFDLDADRQPGLLDAGPRLLVIARAPRDGRERSQVFHRTRPRKVTAAATVCRDADGRMLVVHDRYRRIWTIPGGVVDAGEDPVAAARRETWEEAGVKTEIGRLLGTFSAQWPDRMIFVFAATPNGATRPQPVHRHEVSDAQWVTVDEALTRLAPHVAFQVSRCLEQPGYSWVQ